MLGQQTGVHFRLNSTPGRPIIYSQIEPICRLLGPDINGFTNRGLDKWTDLPALELKAANCGTDTLLALQYSIYVMARDGLIEFSSGSESPAAILVPIAYPFFFNLAPVIDDVIYRMSRFCYLHKGAENSLILESPRGKAKVFLKSAQALIFVHELASGTSVENFILKERTQVHPSEFGFECRAILQLLQLAGAVEQCDERGRSFEDIDPVLRQWDFHDLLFHFRSRIGRHGDLMGGSYRFKTEIAPLPAIKEHGWHSGSIPMPVVNRSAGTDRSTIPFYAVLENRRSVREQGDRPISLTELGEFLYQSARVRAVKDTPFGQLSNRPYPNGGASYELELYLTVNRCQGINPGFYYYDALNHVICPICEPNKDTEMMLDLAFQSSARTCRPQVLITIASRFQRVSWKYAGMAYATQLKNVGALYATMYLVGTAMGLAPCGLGLGDAELFSRMTGLPPFVEGSVGEFMIGSSSNA